MSTLIGAWNGSYHEAMPLLDGVQFGTLLRETMAEARRHSIAVDEELGAQLQEQSGYAMAMTNAAARITHAAFRFQTPTVSADTLLHVCPSLTVCWRVSQGAVRSFFARQWATQVSQCINAIFQAKGGDVNCLLDSYDRQQMQALCQQLEGKEWTELSSHLKPLNRLVIGVWMQFVDQQEASAELRAVIEAYPPCLDDVSAPSGVTHPLGERLSPLPSHWQAKWHWLLQEKGPHLRVIDWSKAGRWVTNRLVGALFKAAPDLERLDLSHCRQLVDGVFEGHSMLRLQALLLHDTPVYGATLPTNRFPSLSDCGPDLPQETFFLSSFMSSHKDNMLGVDPVFWEQLYRQCSDHRELHMHNVEDVRKVLGAAEHYRINLSILPAALGALLALAALAPQREAAELRVKVDEMLEDVKSRSFPWYSDALCHLAKLPQGVALADSLSDGLLQRYGYSLSAADLGVKVSNARIVTAQLTKLGGRRQRWDAALTAVREPLQRAVTELLLTQPEILKDDEGWVKDISKEAPLATKCEALMAWVEAAVELTYLDAELKESNAWKELWIDLLAPQRRRRGTEGEIRNTALHSETFEYLAAAGLVLNIKGEHREEIIEVVLDRCEHSPFTRYSLAHVLIGAVDDRSFILRVGALKQRLQQCSGALFDRGVSGQLKNRIFSAILQGKLCPDTDYCGVLEYLHNSPKTGAKSKESIMKYLNDRYHQTNRLVAKTLGRTAQENEARQLYYKLLRQSELS